MAPKKKSRRPGPRNVDLPEDVLRRLVLAWNPIGAPVPSDEYDCLIKPLLGKLRQGCNQEFLCRFLREWVGEHLGLSGDHGVDAFAGVVSGWYRELKRK
jgi:hypothetical protein